MHAGGGRAWLRNFDADSKVAANAAPRRCRRQAVRRGWRRWHGKIMHWINLAPLRPPDRRVGVVAFEFRARDRRGRRPDRE